MCAVEVDKTFNMHCSLLFLQNMSDKSNQDSSSVELALEADPSMVASRPTSATEESLQEQATREAQVQQGEGLFMFSSDFRTTVKCC